MFKKEKEPKIKKEPKLKKEKKVKPTFCKSCGNEILTPTKFCTNCGAKIKKPIYKKKRFLIPVFFFLFIGIVGGSGDSDPDNDTNAKDTTQQEVIDENKIPEPDGVKLKTDFEKSVWEVIYNHNAELWSIETIIPEGSDETTLTVGIGIENDENAVNALMNDLAALVTSTDTKDGMILVFGDINDGKDGDALVMGAINADGTTSTAMESPDYKTARNQWISNQFSVWDGAHTVMEDLIIDNLNDEKSYKHIETTYRDITTEAVANEVNKILADAGYSQRVAVGDLFVTSTFSAKNAFGGTIKNTAFGISKYADNTFYLIDIG